MIKISSRAIAPIWSRIRLEETFSDKRCRIFDGSKVLSVHFSKRFFCIFDQDYSYQIIMNYKDPYTFFNGLTYKVVPQRKIIWRYKNERECREDFIRISKFCLKVESPVY